MDVKNNEWTDFQILTNDDYNDDNGDSCLGSNAKYNERKSILFFIFFRKSILNRVWA